MIWVGLHSELVKHCCTFYQFKHSQKKHPIFFLSTLSKHTYVLLKCTLACLKVNPTMMGANFAWSISLLPLHVLESNQLRIIGFRNNCIPSEHYIQYTCIFSTFLIISRNLGGNPCSYERYSVFLPTPQLPYQYILQIFLAIIQPSALIDLFNYWIIGWCLWKVCVQ